MRPLGRKFAFECQQCRRHSSTACKIFKEGDVVLLKPTEGRNRPPFLSKPLSTSGWTDTHRGPVEHSSIIGKRVRDVIPATQGVSFRLHEPTLAEYIALTPRLVTPIYPADTNLIISLLDIHVSPPLEFQNEPPLEILEAGTGHGALTLHLARAIHAANTVRPPLTGIISRIRLDVVEEPDQVKRDEDRKITEAFQEWKATRQAVIHTLDISRTHSKHAEKVVRGFRNGIYYGNVDFHVGELPDFLANRNRASSNSTADITEASDVTCDGEVSAMEHEVSAMERATDTHSADPIPTTPSPGITENSAPFLSHCILDLPDAHQQLELVTRYLNVDGKVVVFVPSITQIADAVETIQNLRLPLILTTVLELGNGISGGKEWDVRLVKIRAREKAALLAEGEEARETDANKTEAVGKGDMGMVCRPKVGKFIIGGGFIGVWTKMRERDD